MTSEALDKLAQEKAAEYQAYLGLAATPCEALTNIIRSALAKAQGYSEQDVREWMYKAWHDGTRHQWEHDPDTVCVMRVDHLLREHAKPVTKDPA